ncbi:hypothetical protein H5410_032272 [Solanum commersonii]|uniref:Uncharacterized protein n=1 Tax=Solanum commersonii TaxID=4109 RepID=A0A9J5YPV9_SOLCO|nr:hypothetical protein H5410_032272 [Solanum commersonii]
MEKNPLQGICRFILDTGKRRRIQRGYALLSFSSTPCNKFTDPNGIPAAKVTQIIRQPKLVYARTPKGGARVKRSGGGQYLLVSGGIFGRKGIRGFLKEKNAQYRRLNGK